MTFKQTWWDTNLPNRMEEFTSWIGSSAAASKVYLREHIKQMNYKSVIDLGCGPATEYAALKKDIPDIVYLGVDSSKVLCEKNKKEGIPILLASAESTGLQDNYAECVFSRHVLEHQPDFKDTLKEMLRLAAKEAIHIFFIPPTKGKGIISHDKKENLYHNQYNEKEIEAFLLSSPKVISFKWEKLQQEIVLHIKVSV